MRPPPSLFHLYSCQYGTFLHNNDKERLDSRVKERTRSVWDYFLARRKMWLNDQYNPAFDGQEHEREVEGGRVLFPRTGSGAIKWWAQCWGREDHEMNGAPIVTGIMADTTQSSCSPGTGAVLPGATGSVKGLTLDVGAKTPARKASGEDLGVEMM